MSSFKVIKLKVSLSYKQYKLQSNFSVKEDIETEGD